MVAGDAKKAAEKTHKCSGANACKGQGACGAADGSHACAGKNECKGKGWVKVASEKDCTDKGGTIVKEEKKKEEKKA
jgi:hypothetical protein